MNENEKRVASALEEKGYKILARGWPDFLCVKSIYEEEDPGEGIRAEYEVMCVEVKAGGDVLRKEQIIAHSILIGLGVPVYTIWAEEEERIQDRLEKRAFKIESSADRGGQELVELKRRVQKLEGILERATRIAESSLRFLGRKELLHILSQYRGT